MDYYIEDNCGFSSETITLNKSHPITLHLSRQTFDQYYCDVNLTTTDEKLYLEIKGFLGQLIFNENKSNENQLYFTYNSSLDEDNKICKNIFTNQLLISVDNSMNSDINNLSNDLMPTTLVIQALNRDQLTDFEDTRDCIERDECSDISNCMTTEDGSGGVSDDNNTIDTITDVNILLDNNRKNVSINCSEDDNGSDCQNKEFNSNTKPIPRASISGSNTWTLNQSLILLVIMMALKQVFV
ncbi:uncharacterized protein LOC128966533 [Oppia nitens]|uniref:uncharacterized protein LOC128966533 n=1 Tax=Oppia nitens TaxID=1686743 RepID=UPI0023DA3C4E|nr:uncharacterized protein LOC128966533 [Oppia nitens]